MPFRKGVSGNPGGSRKRRVITQQLIAALNEIDPKDGITKLRKVVDQLVEKAIGGDISAIKEVIDRVDGRVPQGIVGDDDQPPIGITSIKWVIVEPRHHASEEGLQATDLNRPRI
jgi:hypothetical protein